MIAYAIGLVLPDLVNELPRTGAYRMVMCVVRFRRRNVVERSRREESWNYVKLLQPIGVNIWSVGVTKLSNEQHATSAAASGAGAQCCEHSRLPIEPATSTRRQ